MAVGGRARRNEQGRLASIASLGGPVLGVALVAAACAGGVTPGELAPGGMDRTPDRPMTTAVARAAAAAGAATDAPPEMPASPLGAAPDASYAAADGGVPGTGPPLDRAAAPTIAEADAGASVAVGAGENGPSTARSSRRVSVVLEQPFRLDQRAVPQTPDAWKAYIHELRAWNDGGYGTLLAPPPAPVGHPDPRVIVNVERARGALDAKTVEKIARQYHWIQVVRCYRLGAYANQQLGGVTRARFVIGRAGKVGRRTMRSTDLEDGAVARCIVDRLAEISFPKRAGATTVELMVKVGPGDEPMPPPEELIVAGTGELGPDEMLGPVNAASPRFAACLAAAATYAPELWGRLELRFHLTAKGVLDEVFDAVGRFPDRRVSQCVLREARGLRFATPKKGDLRFIVPIRLATDRASPPVGPSVVPLGEPLAAGP